MQEYVFTGLLQSIFFHSENVVCLCVRSPPYGILENLLSSIILMF